MDDSRVLPMPGGKYRIAYPFRYRPRAFKFGAPIAPQCPNGVQIWGHAAPAVSKRVHHGLARRCHGAGARGRGAVPRRKWTYGGPDVDKWGPRARGRATHAL